LNVGQQRIGFGVAVGVEDDSSSDAVEEERAGAPNGITPEWLNDRDFDKMLPLGPPGIPANKPRSLYW
jgi:hypothetical protein